MNELATAGLRGNIVSLMALHRANSVLPLITVSHMTHVLGSRVSGASPLRGRSEPVRNFVFEAYHVT